MHFGHWARCLVLLSSVVGVTSSETTLGGDEVPSCYAAGQQILCSVKCESGCRGYPPGFAQAGCALETECTTPPPWAAKSVCKCEQEANHPLPSQIPQAAPSCESAGRQALCKEQCESSCRGYPPGFAGAGCAIQSECTNPPSWAQGSVCDCTPQPAPPPPIHYPICSDNIPSKGPCAVTCQGLNFSNKPGAPWSDKPVCSYQECSTGSPYVSLEDFGCSSTADGFAYGCCDTRLCNGDEDELLIEAETHSLRLGGRKTPLPLEVTDISAREQELGEPVCTTCEACCHSSIPPGPPCLACEETKCPHFIASA